MKTKSDRVQPIDCAEAVKRFNDFLDNYIEARFREELVAHISECKHCFDRLEFEQKIKSRVHELVDKKGDKKLAKRIEVLIGSL